MPEKGGEARRRRQGEVAEACEWLEFGRHYKRGMKRTGEGLEFGGKLKKKRKRRSEETHPLVIIPFLAIPPSAC